MKHDKAAAAAAITQFLRALGVNTKDAAFLETGERVAALFIEEYCAGYHVDIDDLVKTSLIKQESGPVIARGLAISTTCPHHLTAATGHATIAFAPKKATMGLGAIGRLANACAQKLTLQEEIGESIVSAIDRHAKPQWVACRIVMRHGCMRARGGGTEGEIETWAIRGASTGVERASIEALVRG